MGHAVQPSVEAAKALERPGRGGLTFRAGFSKEVDGWKLSYFVEGD